MSDFVDGFWPWYVAIISLISIIACAVLLWAAGTVSVAPDAANSHDNTTGHVWDTDLREYNNPLPRWWMWLFIFTVIFSLGYLVAFPGLGSFKGMLNWSTDGEHKQDVSQLKADVAQLYAVFSTMDMDALTRDPRALAAGERVYINQCSQCHASDGGGSKGFPNLTNSSGAWLGERGATHVVNTITNGRTGMMPAIGAAFANDGEISDVAHYVLSLFHSPHNDIKAYSGKKLFSSCAACHGIDGKGNKALGAPNLTDQYWLHGWGEAAIINIVKNGKTNVMPAQSNKLSAEQIQVVTAYVLCLSQSQQAPVSASPAQASSR